MKNYFINQQASIAKSTIGVTGNSQLLSDNAFYLIALVSQLKKMLGPDAQYYYPISREPAAFHNNEL